MMSSGLWCSLHERKMQVEMSDAERGSCFKVIGLQSLSCGRWLEGWNELPLCNDSLKVADVALEAKADKVSSIEQIDDRSI